MKLKVIGSGSKGNAYILENENEALLIEAGVNIKEIKQAFDFDLSKLKGCIVTHEHLDHAKAMHDVMQLGIDVYASKGTLKARNLLNEKRANILTPKESVEIGGFKILPFDVKHDASEPLGFLIDHPDCGKTLFLTDTYYCKYLFKGLSNIIIEANYSKEIINQKYGPESEMEFLRNRILKSHMSLANCKETLKANDLRQVNNIVLIHLSDSNSDEKQFVKEINELTQKNVTAAVNGLEINFNKTPF
ncbi:MBL fold metallo-hydrolase [Flavobacterium oreochromis]|uniref:MBL fold metallo-hydrolase n=1 Tax=Flavobacterium oreochromis TaxID=2906078 RepID=UPI001CE65BFA|nr:MBL fold metallo-hydrolase [Flavobacterium oreochromis]QYS85444.1 MBL fold metallo-hydrolase [Flavobacterium oreochromis]